MSLYIIVASYGLFMYLLGYTVGLRLGVKNMMKTEEALAKEKRP